MATRQTPVVGLDHPTTVPTNLEGEDDESADHGDQHTAQ